MTEPRNAPHPEAEGARRIASALIENLSALSCPASAIELATMTLLAGGHLLIEDVPGTGKTTLARALAASVSARVNRVQFTSDMLPSDLTGVSVFDQQTHGFTFVRGPLFAHVVLADEINRANPKTQAAMLEAMEERRVSVDGTTYPLPRPFIVIATQNPQELEGTYPLPEAQLDRFMCRIHLGYPSAEAETRMLMSPSGYDPVRRIRPVCTTDDVQAAIATAARVHVSAPVARYAVEILAATRAHAGIRLGASPRAGLALLAMSRVRALLRGQTGVYPADVRAMAEPVLAHRVLFAGTGCGAAADQQRDLLKSIVESVPAPRGA